MNLREKESSGETIMSNSEDVMLGIAGRAAGYGLLKAGELQWNIWKYAAKKIFPPNNGEPEQQDVPTEGVFFGMYARTPLIKPINKDGHVLVVGGAGSGKSTCIAIPTLRDSWTAAALVVDIKGELLTKSHRKAHVFNPCDPSAMGYDPFFLLRETTNPIPDIREIALTLVPTPPEVKDPFWSQASQNILTGHLLYAYKQGASFAQALRILQSTAAEDTLEVGSSDADARMYLMQYARLKPETLSGIFAELSNKVMSFATDPEIQTALSKDTIITPALLEQGEDIFIQIPEYKLEQWKALTSLIVQQFLRHFEHRQEGNAPILFMLDEFPRLGKIDAVINGLATLRSKKITIMPIIQSLAQLDATYGHEQRKIICDNCAYKAILNATDADTQEYFSKLVGTEERLKPTYNQSGDVVSGILSGQYGSSTSTTTEEKRIIKPEDFAYLHDELVLLSPDCSARVKTMPYYRTEQLQQQEQQGQPSQMQQQQMQGGTPPPIDFQNPLPTLRGKFDTFRSKWGQKLSKGQPPQEPPHQQHR